MFGKVLGVLALLVSSSVLADSIRLDRESLPGCRSYYGGSASVSLNESSQSLHLNFQNLDLNKCNRLRIFDASSGRTINSYDMSRAGNNPSYTLSRSMIGALASDCNLGFTVSGYGSYPETRYVRLGWCAPTYGYPTYPTYPSYDRITYEWSNAGNCKKMVNGQYSGQNVADYYCGSRPSQQRDYITYEWSNKGNCKKMVNGQYSGQNVSDYYCRR